jgi:hypothetical protein
LEWTLGWDVFTQPLDLDRSFVSYNQPSGSPNTLNITVQLQKATPNTRLSLSVHTFGCTASFGQFAPSNHCGSITRQNQTATVTPFELGAFTTSSAGNGNLSVQVTGLSSGTYTFEFIIRDPAFVGPAIYQSPGPFAVGTTTITVPAHGLFQGLLQDAMHMANGARRISVSCLQ